MKKSMLLILVGYVCETLSGQTPENTLKNSLGAVFSPGYKSADVQLYTLGVRYLHPVRDFFAAGLELNGQRYIGTNGNYSAIGCIGFARAEPFNKGFFLEFGFQINITTTPLINSRQSQPAFFSPFASVGYHVKVKDKMNLEFQFRPLMLFGTQSYSPYRDNTPAKCFIGFYYSL